MSVIRTSLVALAVGTAVVTTTVAATTATAAPGPVAAVTAAAAGTDGSGTTAGSVAGGTARAWWRGLTDAQQQCLRDADIRRPVGPLDDAERAALRRSVEAAAGSCGVELPFAKARAFWDGLTDAQQQCLRDADVTRPWGPMTRDQRQQLRDDLRAAAEACGVTVPRAASTPAT